VSKESWRIRSIWLGVLLGLALTAPLAVVALPKPQELVLLQRIPLPEVPSVATDVRWAGRDSVYVSWFNDGIAEVGLDGAVRRTLAPSPRTLELGNYSNLAASPGRLAAASGSHHLVWRTVRPKAGGSVVFHKQSFRDIYDFDVSGDRVLLLGHRKRELGEPYLPKGEIAWLGRLSEEDELADMTPVLYDLAGPGAPHMANCASYPMNGIRFLPDGSFVVAPGFQDGIHLFNAAGKRVRSWSHEQVGIDSHLGCDTMTKAEEEKFRGDDATIAEYVKSRRLLDDVLPLPEGPGLLVRTWGKDGKPHWTLEVLRPDGIRTYTVPAVGHRVHDRLRGDVRNGRIVLLLSKSGDLLTYGPADLPAEILLMQLPEG
jgi:hypothetical protein